MSKLEVDAIEPQSGTTLTIGASGDTVNIASGATITDFTSTGIDDNATSTAITIDSSENVGIGDTAPDGSLHITRSGSSGQLVLERTTSNTGKFSIGINNGLVFNDLVTSTERMRIDSSGNVGIGTSNPAVKLHILGNVIFGSNANGSASAPYLELNGAGYTGFHWLDGTAYYIGQNSNSRKLRIYSGSNENAGANLNAGATSFSTYSDERLKKDITDLTNGLDKISAIRAVKFKYKTDADDYKTRIGVIAQSLVGQVDEALDLSRLNDTDTTEYYDVRYQDLIPVLIKGVQEQQTKIQELEARITALENA